MEVVGAEGPSLPSAGLFPPEGRQPVARSCSARREGPGAVVAGARGSRADGCRASRGPWWAHGRRVLAGGEAGERGQARACGRHGLSSGVHRAVQTFPPLVLGCARHLRGQPCTREEVAPAPCPVSGVPSRRVHANAAGSLYVAPGTLRSGPPLCSPRQGLTPFQGCVLFRRRATCVSCSPVQGHLGRFYLLADAGHAAANAPRQACLGRLSSVPGFLSRRGTTGWISNLARAPRAVGRN